ncbi:tetratricopeptide repeat protein [Qipengyuania soli]|uniref:Winged helix-turn-helix domain-containing protein n=1 Tax=Qipengyuania soli TaxID=2782568 RepID=A0A7S8F5T0_9SPHN|nr:tetratricopeptide repeat protein [Qipengyuania soli]QPC99749.1 winged helix-turn-helix domain-containing protein [Qipengyuania soli]
MDISRSTLRTAASLADHPGFIIGAIEVDPATRTVRAGRETEKIEPRVMQVLIALAEACNEVLTRDALFDRCWGGVYVGDDSLNRAIAGVRRIATGIAQGTFEVETIPRTGYRLISETGPLWLSELEAPEAGQPENLPGPGISRRWAIAGGLTIAAGGAAYLLFSKPDPATQLVDESQVAMRAGTPESMMRAIKLLEQAVSVSPHNSAAWGLLAMAYARIDEHAIEKAQISATKVEEAANRALQLDPGNADAKAALAIYIPYYGDWLAAERRFDAVLAEHPDHLYTKDARLFFMGAVGRMKESGIEREKLNAEAPFDASFAYKQVYSLWFLDRIAEADRVAQRGLEMWPRDPGMWFAKLWLLAGTGRLDRAIAQVADAASRPPLPPPLVGTLMASLQAAKSREPAGIEAASRQVMGGVSRSVAAVVSGMMLLNIMGAIDQAFALADAYYLERGPVIAAMQWRPGQPFVPDQRRRKTNMLFVPSGAQMQQDPRFMSLMQEIGMTDYWDKRGIGPDFLRPA